MMNKPRQKYNLLIGFLFIISQINGQIRFQVTPTLEGNFSLERIFQFSVINMNPIQIENGSINIQVQELGGELIAEYNSTALKVKPNETLIGTDIDWLKSIEYTSSVKGGQWKDIGTLPFGNYSICYKFLGSKSTSSKYCTEVNARPLLPPQLLFPSQGSTISTVNPLLSWIPPLPDMGVPYNYSLKVVEKKEGQTCISAMLQNLAIIKEVSYENTSYQPDNIRGLDLETGKSYCWQVEVYNKKAKLGHTEIWQFTIDTLTTVSHTKDDNMPYYYLKQTLDGDNVKIRQFLKIVFDNRYGQSQLNYNIYNEENRENISVSLNKINLYSGLNQISFDCTSIKKLKPNQSYILVVTDANDTQYFCRFTYEKP